MIALLLCGLIAGACAAPLFDFPIGSPQPFLSNENVLSQRFSSPRLIQKGFEGGEYKIMIFLPEFDKEDIAVNTQERFMLIQANHKCTEGNYLNYLNLFTLPDTVDGTGHWVFVKGVLIIIISLKEESVVSSTETTLTTTEQQMPSETVRPYFQGSREKIETNANEGAQDVDVGLGRGDLDKENELKTNVVTGRNAVEATTFA